MRLVAFRDAGDVRYGVVEGDKVQRIPDAATPFDAARLAGVANASKPGGSVADTPSWHPSCR